MLHILLLILKIIGIVLLVILGVLLLGIACALFVPVRYRIEAARQEGEGQPPVTVRVKVTWLLCLINFLLRFDGELFVRARILFFTVFRMPKKEKRRKMKEQADDVGKKKQEDSEKRNKKEELVQSKDEAESGRSAESLEEIAPDSAETQGDHVKGSDTQQTDKISQEHYEDFLDVEGAKEKPGFWDKLRVIPEILRKLFEKIKGFFENIQYTIRRFCDKIGSISETIEYYREVVEGETFKRSFALCKGELLTIVKSLKPRKFEASLIVGMDDPASTGEILAVCGMLYPLLGGHVDVRGDFEKKRLEGQILIVGKLRMFTFLRTAVRIYFNKDIRKLYKLLKKEAVNG